MARVAWSCDARPLFKYKVRGGTDKSLVRPGGKKSYSDQTRDLFNILPTKLNTVLGSLL